MEINVGFALGVRILVQLFLYNLNKFHIFVVKR